MAYGNYHTDLTFYYQNANGIRTKTEELFANVASRNNDIYFLTETNLYSEIRNRDIFDSRYDVFRRDRNLANTDKQTGGGVLIAVKKDAEMNAENLGKEFFTGFKLKRMCTFEDLWIKIEVGWRQLFLGLVYFPPKSKGSLYDYILKKARFVKDRPGQNDLMVLGDFNRPNFLECKRATGDSLTIDQNIIEEFQSCGLDQVNDFRNCSGRVLDLVFLNDNGNFDYHLKPVRQPIVEPDEYHPPFEIVLTPKMPNKPFFNSVPFRSKV